MDKGSTAISVSVLISLFSYQCWVVMCEDYVRMTKVLEYAAQVNIKMTHRRILMIKTCHHFNAKAIYIIYINYIVYATLTYSFRV